MAFSGGAATNQTSTGNISFGLQIYYDNKFLSKVSENVVLNQIAQKRPIPKGKGKQIRFFRYHQISNVTTPLTEGVNPDPTVITGHEVNATLEEWGDWSQHSSLVSETHIDRGLAKVAELWGDQAGASIDLRTMKEIVTNGCYAIRADVAAPTSGWTSTVDTTTTTATTTTFAGAATCAGATDNCWIGGQVIFTSGANYGQARYITDFTAATKAFVVTLPFENAPANGDAFTITHVGAKTATPVADAMDSTDLLTTSALRAVWERLKLNKAKPLNGGYYVGVISPTVHSNFTSDSTWLDVGKYQDATKLYKNELGKWLGFRFLETTQPFRAALPTMAGTTTLGVGQSGTSYYQSGSQYSETGAGYHNLFFGREAFGVTYFPGQMTPKILVKNPGPHTTSDPLNRRSTVGWQLTYVPRALNALWCVDLVSGG